MKRLFLVLMLLIIAGSAFAAELKVSGDMYVRGTEWGNKALLDGEGDDAKYDYFDYDLNVNMAFVANENATVFTKLTFDKNVDGKGTIADGGASADDAGLAVERAYLNYKFAPFLQLNTGLMAGGQWATAFGDTEINVMRVQFIGALSQDMIFIATYQKDNENGYNATDTDDNEKDDQQTYYLSAILKAGPITFKPLFTFTQMGIGYQGEIFAGYMSGLAEAGLTDATVDAYTQATYGVPAGTFTTVASLATYLTGTKKYDASVMSGSLGIDGDFGMVGFESEFVYVDMDTDGFYDDHKDLSEGMGAYDGVTYGIYVNLFAKLDPAKIGFIYAYASADDKDGYYSWGEDFDIAYVMDDFINNGDTSSATLYGDNLIGFTAYKVYADAAFGKFGVGAAAIYGTSNIKNDDAKFTEIDANVSYAFDDNTKYTIGGGYAMTEDWNNAGDSADAYRVFHKFAVTF